MRQASLFLTAVIALILSLAPVFARAAETREILLGPRDHYELTETEQWRFDVQQEVAGRFADVQILPKRGNAFLLTLYFIADTPDLSRLNTPEKIASSVLAGSERFLPLSVEKKVTLQALTPRGSYGSLTVMTEADPKTAPGGFKYHTRGMVRLSPDAALGFSLLSRELNTETYRQLLNYVYGFIKLPPGGVAAPAAPPAPTTAATPTPVPAPTPVVTPVVTPTPSPRMEPAAPRAEPAPAPTPTPATSAPPPPRPSPTPRGAQRDMRECLKLPTDAEIIRCASGRR